jgi:hypothetical protein
MDLELAHVRMRGSKSHAEPKITGELLSGRRRGPHGQMRGIGILSKIQRIQLFDEGLKTPVYIRHRYTQE